MDHECWQCMGRECAVTSKHRLDLQQLQLEAETIELPFAEQQSSRRRTLTVDLVYTGVDGIGSAIERNVANTKTLPVSQQADKVTANLTTTDMEAERLGSWLDVKEARKPVHLHIRWTRTRS